MQIGPHLAAHAHFLSTILASADTVLMVNPALKSGPEAWDFFYRMAGG